MGDLKPRFKAGQKVRNLGTVYDIHAAYAGKYVSTPPGTLGEVLDIAIDTFYGGPIGYSIYVRFENGARCRLSERALKRARTSRRIKV